MTVKGWYKFFAFSLSFLLVFQLSSVSYAQGRQAIVRDAEIEQLMRDYAKPLFKAAGLRAGYVNIHLVNSSAFNAFVTDSQNMYITTGTIMGSKTPNAVIGVIAHETGHIAGGHLQSLRDALSGARTIALIATLLGVGASAAAIASNGSGDSVRAGSGIIAGGQDAARRALLSHRRAEENAADRLAFKYLEKTKQSAAGMIATFEKFNRDLPLSARYRDPYLLSHPLPRERLVQMKQRAAKSPFVNKGDSPAFVARHALARAKLAGFTRGQRQVAQLYPRSDKSLAADYARAIAQYRYGNVKRAIKRIDKLIARQPNNPYFWELKGQALLETGQPRAAIAPLQKAFSLSGKTPLLQILLGKAQVATEDNGFLSAAIANLKEGLRRDGTSSDGYRQLAIAYARAGKIGEAELATANGFFYAGNYGTARLHATRAQKKLKVGSSTWLQADDIATFKPPKL